MNFFQRILNFFSGRATPKSRYLSFYVLSTRCNEPLMGQVDTQNELSQTDEGEYPLYARKVLATSGKNRCFSQVEVELWFNQNKQIAKHEVQGGRWLDADEYLAEVARSNEQGNEE
jgi:hypothetical protein